MINFVKLYIDGAERGELDSFRDKHAVIFANLDEDSQVKFKRSAKRFVKLYNFLGAILPKLPVVKDDDFPSGLY